jgi:hypothetical protein
MVLARIAGHGQADLEVKSALHVHGEKKIQKRNVVFVAVCRHDALSQLLPRPPMPFSALNEVY